MLTIHLVELGGADSPGAIVDGPPAIGIDRLDTALAIIGGILVGVIGGVVLAPEKRAAGQEGQARAQKQSARNRLQTDRDGHWLPYGARKASIFNSLPEGPRPVRAFRPLYTVTSAPQESVTFSSNPSPSAAVRQG